MVDAGAAFRVEGLVNINPALVAHGVFYDLFWITSTR